ncbi:MAG: biotin transporter BioY [Candidatus Eremiobacteraeota bacterium]|nr:biotin transporter BioY [Candidatus Eremiobacteraeota bacterium]
MKLSARDIIRTALFASLTALGGFLSVPLPFGLVPLTLQSLFTMLSGLLLGPFLGPLSQALYVVMGAFNFPVFSGGAAGLAVLFGPTGGYLWGFIAGSLIIGVIAGSKNDIPRLLAALIAGTAAIYACGVAQLAFVTHMSFSAALMTGLVPFLPGDAVKIALALVVVRRIPENLRR